MPDFKPTEDIISMSEFRTTLADCAVRTAETHRPIILTQNGRATSVFLSAADWESITNKLSRIALYEDYLIGEGESQRNELVSQEEVNREIDAVLRKYEPAPTKKAKGKRRTQKIEAA